MDSDAQIQGLSPNFARFSIVQVRPGLSSYAENINDIRNHVIQLVAKVKQNVPEEVQEETPLLFMATAGKFSFFFF